MLRWEQLILFGAGHPAPPAAICEAAPLLCSLQDTLYGPDLSGWPAAGEIKGRITSLYTFCDKLAYCIIIL